MIRLAPERDALLTDFGKTTLLERYCLPGEGFQGLFARVASTYADDEDHAQRVYDYISQLWFMPATPVLSNGGAGRGLPISCFLNTVEDSMDGIKETWNENVDLAKNGGGIGTYWGGVRSVGEGIGLSGGSSGIIPFIHVQDSLSLAVNQGSLRRGSAAVYLDVWHPEIVEFLEIRKPTGGDQHRKALNLHHGVNLDDAFMRAVDEGTSYGLRSPKTGAVVKEVSARELWQKIMDLRLTTGEPYLVFSDRANEALPSYQRDLGLRVRQSNLCSEIMLATDEERTAVCCLSSLNAETFFQWKDEIGFIEDVMRFLDNVLQDFIDRAPPTMKRAIYSAQRERAVGLGLMGFHSFLQSINVPFEGPMAKSWNRRIFRFMREEADEASYKLALEKGPCPDAATAMKTERFSHKLAIAPTASISIIAGGTSAGIEPVPANIYTAKTLTGTKSIRNRHLQRLLASLGKDTTTVWDSILEHEGSVQHLDFLDDHQKAVFRTAFEIDQRWIIEHAADRAPLICQAQSVNLFLPGDVEKWDLHMLHFTAWEKGLKSLYYLRSKSVQRAAHAGAVTTPLAAAAANTPTNYEECLACQ